MAKPPCTWCNERESVMMTTNLIDGDTQCACGVCLPMQSLTMAATFTAGMPAEAAEAYGELFDQIAANDTRAPKAKPKSRAKRSATGDQAGDPGSDGPVEGDTTPPPEPQTATNGAEGNAEGYSEQVTLPEPCSDCGSTTATGDMVKLTCDGCGAVLATAEDIPG